MGSQPQTHDGRPSVPGISFELGTRWELGNSGETLVSHGRVIPMTLPVPLQLAGGLLGSNLDDAVKESVTPKKVLA